MILQIVYAFQSIEKKVIKGRIKVSPWCIGKLFWNNSFVNPMQKPVVLCNF